jgi:hypothetical protein
MNNIILIKPHPYSTPRDPAARSSLLTRAAVDPSLPKNRSVTTSYILVALEVLVIVSCSGI